MGKVIVLCFAFLAMTLVMCQEETPPCEQKSPCTSNDDCCGNWCNPWGGGVCTAAPGWISGVSGGQWARGSVATSGGAPAVASGGVPAPLWPPWMIGGGWWRPGKPWGPWGSGGSGGEQGAGGWMPPWWGQGGSRAASGAEWEESAK